MPRLRDVVSFEVRRNIKKKSFWITSLMPPIIVIVIISISAASSHSAKSSSQQQADTISKNAKIAVLDETGLISQQQLSKIHIAVEPTKDVGIAAVKADKLDAFFYYPSNITKSGIEIYSQDKGISLTPPYNAASIALLKQNVVSEANLLTHNSQIVQLLQYDPNVTAITYKNGKQTNGIANLIAPGIFMVAFLSVIILSSYFMITSTTEEKENRVAEILLTAIKSRSLILGKILAIFTLGLMQILIIVVPLLIAYALFKSHITLPGGVSLSHIPLDPKAIVFGALFFVGGLLMFTGFLVGISALFPNAQEAGRFMGPAFISAFLPIYTISFIISSPHSLIVSVFAYFPLTAPTTALLRNTVGTLSVTQAIISLVVITASAALTMTFAVRAFRYGAMEYGRRISLKELLH